MNSVSTFENRWKYFHCYGELGQENCGKTRLDTNLNVENFIGKKGFDFTSYFFLLFGYIVVVDSKKINKDVSKSFLLSFCPGICEITTRWDIFIFSFASN